MTRFSFLLLDQVSIAAEMQHSLVDGKLHTPFAGIAAGIGFSGDNRVPRTARLQESRAQLRSGFGNGSVWVPPVARPL